MDTPGDPQTGKQAARRPAPAGPRPRILEARLKARPALPGIAREMGWVSGLVLAISSFTSWYSGESLEGPTLSVTGWNSGSLGKLVFLVGVAVICLSIMRSFGVVFPPGVPEPLLVALLGALATVFVLIRLISIPPSLVGTSGRSVGIWISLVAAIAVIVSGILQAREEL